MVRLITYIKGVLNIAEPEIKTKKYIIVTEEKVDHFRAEGWKLWGFPVCMPNEHGPDQYRTYILYQALIKEE